MISAMACCQTGHYFAGRNVEFTRRQLPHTGHTRTPSADADATRAPAASTSARNAMRG